jgi:uncharacterized protein YqjF (DUF2071 family)
MGSEPTTHVNHQTSTDTQSAPSKERVFLTADWRFLAMLNYVVDPALLMPHVPRGTELDLFNRKAWMSMVGFRFLSAKVLGISIPFHRDFDEVNLRFYVRRVENGIAKRGVVFIQEIVPRFAIATVARLAYNENYRALTMSHRIERSELPSPHISVEYAWRVKSNQYSLGVDAAGEPQPLAEGSEEQFITEHYWGYCVQRDHSCVEYQVAHPSWRVWKAAEARFEGDATALYGRDFAGYLSRPPDSAFLAEGSNVAVYAGRKLAR